MAERRMFSCKITSSDAFKMMSLAAQALYFQLGMEADDDGFVNNAMSIARSIGAGPEAIEEVIEKRFVLRMDEGLLVIKHWKINNWIRKDMYKKTSYQQYSRMLRIKENGAYTEKGSCDDSVTSPLQGRNESVTDSLQNRNTDKDRIDKDSNIPTSLTTFDRLVGGQQVDAPKADEDKTDLFGEKIEVEEENVPYKAIADYWNKTLNGKLPKIKSITDNRRILIKQRWHEYHNDIYGIIDKVAASDFLTGWKACGFDWCFKKDNMVKIAEGNYDNGKRNAGQTFKRDLTGRYDDIESEVIEI